jgi:hypothetical protein
VRTSKEYQGRLREMGGTAVFRTTMGVKRTRGVIEGRKKGPSAITGSKRTRFAIWSQLSTVRSPLLMMLSNERRRHSNLLERRMSGLNRGRVVKMNQALVVAS